MNYNGTVYRPPVEAYTFLIPVTEGCTHNSCTFCNMYQDIPFRMLPLSWITDYLTEVQSEHPGYLEKVKRVYLVGADPFALSAKNLLERLGEIRRFIPKVAVFTMYARTDNIASKSDEDLQALKEAGVNDLYIGVETACNDVLVALKKGYTADETRKQCLRLNKVGIEHADLLMLGTAGKGRGIETAIASAKLENEIKPTKILLNTMSAFEGTQLNRDIQSGAFVPAGEKEILEEEKVFLEQLDLPDTYFWAIHPLDSVKIDGIIKESKEEMLAVLTQAIETVDESRYQRVSRKGTL